MSETVRSTAVILSVVTALALQTTSLRPVIAEEARKCRFTQCGRAEGDSVQISIKASTPSRGGHRTGASEEPKRRNSLTRAQGPRRAALRQLVPTCTGNRPDREDGLCTAATETCSQPDETRFWVYARTWDPTAQPPGYGPAQRADATTCVGPDEPEVAEQVDPRVLVAATVRRDWRTYGLPAGRVITRPAGQTLTGAVTRFSTPVEPQAVLHRTVLGLPVALTVTAESYSWEFGDGTGSKQPAGQPPTAEHTYTRTAALAASLTVVYSGSFTIGDDPQVYEVQGAATVPGPEQPLVVRQARTQLEHD